MILTKCPTDCSTFLLIKSLKNGDLQTNPGNFVICPKSPTSHTKVLIVAVVTCFRSRLHASAFKGSLWLPQCYEINLPSPTVFSPFGNSCVALFLRKYSFSVEMWKKWCLMQYIFFENLLYCGKFFDCQNSEKIMCCINHQNHIPSSSNSMDGIFNRKKYTCGSFFLKISLWHGRKLSSIKTLYYL